jgi:MYXO-CTERM domain-containing protein
MRSIVRRTLAPLASLAFVTAISSVAAADPSATTAERVIAREGSRAPWLHLAPNAARSRMSPSAASQIAVVDLQARARAAVTRVLPQTTGHALTYVATTTDRFGDGDAIVHFEQTHKGLPVVGRGAAVRLSSSGEAILTAIDLEESLPASTIASVPPSVAVKLTSHVAVGTVTEKDVHLVVWPLRGGGSRLAYVVLPQIPAGYPSAPRIIVDAQSGKVLEARDLVQFANASVHRFNPTKTPLVETVELPIAPGATAAGKLSNDFVTAANCIDRKSVKAVDLGGFKANMHVCDIDQLAVADGAGDFLYTPTDTAGAMTSRSDEYSELSIYYHTTKAYEFFRGLQGVPTAQVVADKPLRVVANLQIPAGISTGNILAAGDPNTPLETFSNAFFSPAGGGLGAIFEQIYGFKGGGLWFGQGPQRDYAYDGDVVYHELGHAVVDHSLKLVAWHVDERGAIDSPGAMNEGLADYFSSAITGDPDVGEYASKESSQNSGVIRTLANKDKCPTAVIGEVHFDSTLFSGALWQARVSLPEADRTKFDAAIYKAMRTNPGRGDLGFGDAAKLFAATLATDLPAGKTALEAAMTDRGVLPSCERIFEFTTAPIKAFDPAVGGFTAPGTQSVSVGDFAPGIIQVHGKATPDVGHQLVVSFTSRKAGGGGNPLGGQATPYAPVVLAKFGKPITWTPSSTVGHDADLTVPAVGTGKQTATFEVPAGTTDIYVQIANKGESDGAYDGVTLTLGPSTIAPPVPEPVAPLNPGEPATAPATTGGCGCSTPGQTPAGLPLGLLAGLALAAGVVRRRRRA